MAVHFLTDDGRPTPRKGSAARNSQGLYRFEYRILRGAKSVRRRFWAESMSQALDIEARAKGQARGISWRSALGIWGDGVDRVPKYVKEVGWSVGRLLEFLGVDDADIQDLTFDQFRDFVLDRQRVGARAANKDRQQCLAIARWAMSEGYVDSLPFEAVRVRSVKSPKRVPVPVEMVPKYIEALPDYARPIVSWIAYTGVRAGEACRLQWQDVDLRVGGRVSFRQKGGRVGGLFLDPFLFDIVESSRRVSKKSTGSVFVNSRGNPWTVESLGNRVRKVWEKVEGLPMVTLHQFRHTFGTIAGSKFSVDMVRAGLGHSSRRSSEVYVDPTDEMRDQVGRAVRRMLINGPENDTKMTCLTKDLRDGPGQSGTRGVEVEDPRDGVKVWISWGLLDKLKARKG